ncbi:sensor histidine kinase [Rufibacter sediminis]|uniref:histidine kinase n=1 Tax=Rufibacter sediminis TaxID=2762756 RepID=A0ABR6VWJ8_9BACT|nr:HAMP domain-containing sensor histidine kinase [Rufibacter sediminis]MBC3541528.1 HAMP domain-containing histidine kinase [Rufibacter sediminis]
MKYRYTLPLFFFLLSLLLGGVAAFLQVSVQRDLLEAPEKQMVEEVQERLHGLLKKSRQEMELVTADLPLDSAFFSENLPKTTTPLFVYKQNKLVFWSEHSLRPELEPRYLTKMQQVVENRFGRFVVLRHQPSPEYSVLAVVPLEVKYGINNAYLRSGLNPEIFEDHVATVQLEGGNGAIPIADENGNYLFSLRVLEPGQWLHADKFTLSLYLLSFLSAVVALVTLYQRLRRNGRVATALWTVLLGLLFVRAVMLLSRFPSNVQELELFSPRVYAASWWSPSLGDLLLNEICFLVMALLVYRFSRPLRFTSVFYKTTQKKLWSCIVIGVIITVLIISWYETYRSLFINSQPHLDITQNIQIGVEKLLLYLVMILHTLAMSWILRLLLNALPFTAQGKLPFAYSWMTVLVLALGWAFWRDAPSGNWVVLFASAALVGWEQLHRNLGQRAGIYSSIFMLNILSASLGAAALYDLYTVQLRSDKQRLASQLLKDRDDLTEYLLAQAADDISQDFLIQQVFNSPWGKLNTVEQKILRHHLRAITENYAVTVRIFDFTGESFNDLDSLSTLEAYAQRWGPRSKSTNQRGQLLVASEPDPGKFMYLQEIKIPVAFEQWVTVVLEVSPKLTAPNSVLPELLVERKTTPVNTIPSSSYALRKGNRWLKTEGYFEYGQHFSPRLFDIPQLYTQGLSLADYHHQGARANNGTVALVSTPSYGAGSWLSNFSFLFLLHTFSLFSLLLLVMLYRGHLIESILSTFGTKIQLFLNLGVLVPLVLVSITIGSLVTDSYRQDLIRGYTDQGEFVRQNILTSNWGANLFKGRPDSLSRRINRLAVVAQAELNIYNADGQLRLSSQPALFEAGVLSTRLNPQAFEALKEQGLNRILLEEKAGTLPYSTIYVPLRVSPNTPPKGYLAIPFFDSEKELNNKLIQLITTILNIFSVLFLLFVLMSYMATRALTVPLQLLTERLKRTSLTGNNEKLVYQSRDEIGLLVHEYNQMLQKLEESKQELTLREKEAAWKEMARQVAHEIKNPLTPMKLSLQYLRKAMQDGRSNLEELVEKISNTMITQIDVLSDIATSFSNFTAMPELKLEILELNSLIRRTTDLHLNPQQHRVDVLLPEETVYVKADENQLIRIFNNLLLNALQAVPSAQTPEIKVTLQLDGTPWALVSIQDNGTGIPADVQPKIFIPNFSTKYSGSGIGLAVVKKGVEAIGGSIWFETQENVGTTFFLKLPVVPS